MESQTEPIPGYRLLERLGQGGFGEVWKAQAPGGLFKAVKIVYGCLEAGDGEENRAARQELKSLERVKTVRHPFILSLERYDIINGRLTIVTELADRSLWDRFRECRTQGLPGIPRDELLGYLEETAEALDLMNTEHQLQHLDIKPQNLFLLYNHIKVGDFGLVKDMAGMRTQVTSGFTVTYASPETFQGQVSRFSDQYSLAIVYQELLTGQLPFTGTNPQHLMVQHMTGSPNLAPLPPLDRDAIGRALAKNPEDRHSSCGNLVLALRRGGQEQTSATLASAGGNSGSRAETPSRKRSATALPAGARLEGSAAAAPCLTPDPSPLAASAPERPEVTGDGVLFPALVVGLGGLGLDTVRQLRKALRQRYGPAATFPHIRLLQVDTDPEIVERATKEGADSLLRENEIVLTRLQRPAHYLKSSREREAIETWLPMRMLSRLPRDQVTAAGWRPLGRLAFVTNRPAIVKRLRAELEACTDPGAIASSDQQTGLGLRSNRPRVYVVTSLTGGTGSGMFIDLAYEARHLLRQLGYAASDVVGLFFLPADGNGSGQPRALANAFAAVAELNHFAADQQSHAGPAGGKGPPFDRCFVLPLPEEPAPEKVRGQQSGVGEGPHVARLAGDFLSWDLTTPLGRTADRCRAEVSAAKPEGVRDEGSGVRQGLADSAPRTPDPRPGILYQTFGAFWFTVPRRPLLQRVARCLGRRLVETWKTEEHPDQAIQAWVAEQLTRRELSPERLTDRLHAACASRLDQQGRGSEASGQGPGLRDQGSVALTRDPAPLTPSLVEALCDTAIDQRIPGGPAELGRRPDAGVAALGEIEELLAHSHSTQESGMRGEGSATATPSLSSDPSRLTASAALSKAVHALQPELNDQLADVALAALSAPQFRLTGADGAVRGRLLGALAQAARNQKALAADWAQQTADLHELVVCLQTKLSESSRWWGNRAKTAADLLEALRQYARAGCQTLTAQQVGDLYAGLLVELPNYLRDINCCQPRIAQFLQRFADSGARGQPPVHLGLGQYLLPGGCRTLDEAANHLLAGLTPEELLDLNQKVQALFGKKFQQQVHVCTAPGTFFKELEEEVYNQVAACAEAQLTKAHAAEVYLDQHPDDGPMLADLSAAFAEANPKLPGLPSSQELCFLAVPPGPEGKYFHAIAARALPDRKLIPAAGTNDIVFYREQHLPASALPSLGPAGFEAYHQLLAMDHFTPHSRSDIVDWLPAPPERLD
jgi:hypothetical protein